MRSLLSLAIVLALPGAALAAVPDCTVSFSGAEQNVCTGAVSTSSTALEGLASLDAVKDSTLRLVKFGAPITTEQRNAVEAAGARIISYAPSYAYIVRMSPQLDAAMQAIEGVVWSGPFLPALKVDPNIFSQLQGNDLISALGISTLSVALDSEANQAAARGTFAAIPGIASSKLVTSGGETRVLAEFNPSQLADTVQALALNPDVLNVSLRKPKLPMNSQGHWLHQSNVSSPTPVYSIWDKGIFGCGQIVAELDTGLWMAHDSFRDDNNAMPIDVCDDGAGCPTIAEPNFDARKVVAYYKWSGLPGGDWGDNHGHGTHVGGSIAGNNNMFDIGTSCDGLPTPDGTSDLVGMAPYAKLVMQETGGTLEYLNTQGGTAYHMAEVAYANGARLHSDSWGDSCVGERNQCIAGCTMEYDEFARDSDQAMWDHDDLLIVYAAGNDGTTCGVGNSLGSPGNAKNVLTIGATSRGSSANSMASFSSRGPTLDGRTKPDLTAQGSSIRSASRSASGTATMSGTSMATPTSSGLAALVRDYLAQGFYPDGVKNPADAITTPSGALVKAILTVGAFHMTGSGAGANPGQAQGWGRILLDGSLYFDGDASRLFIYDAPGGLVTDGVQTHTLNVNAGEPLKVVLTWSDHAAALHALPATVNSLRLEVEAPNGDVWTQKLPADFDLNNADPLQDTTEDNYDNLNTVQRITLDAPDAGLYQIRVRGINVPDGPQKYAIAATGDFTADVPTSQTVGGQVSGLRGSNLSLKLNGSNDLPIAVPSNTSPVPFTFATDLPSGASYEVTVGTQPSGQLCTVDDGVGVVAGADITDVQVICAPKTYTVGGTVSGLQSPDMVLSLTRIIYEDESMDEEPLLDFPVASDGVFTFPVDLLSGWMYVARIANQPLGQTCTIANDSSIIYGASVSNVEVTCTNDSFTVGGSVAGLAGTGLILQLNGGNDLPLSADGPFTFTGALEHGASYEVTIAAQPDNQECSVDNGSGTIAGAAVTDVEISCGVDSSDIIFIDGFDIL